MPLFKIIAPLLCLKNKESKKPPVSEHSNPPQITDLPCTRPITLSELMIDPIMRGLYFSKHKSWFVGGSYALSRFLSNSGHIPEWKPNDVDVFLPIEQGGNQLEKFDEGVGAMVKYWNKPGEIELVSRFSFEPSHEENGKFVIIDRDNLTPVSDKDMDKYIVNKGALKFNEEPSVYSNFKHAIDKALKEQENLFVAVTNYEFIGPEHESDAPKRSYTKSSDTIIRTKKIKFIGISTQNGTREEGLTEFEKWSDLPSNVSVWAENRKIEFVTDDGFKDTFFTIYERFAMNYDVVRGLINGWFDEGKVEESRKKKYEERGFVFKREKNQIRRNEL
jgi:hypothetical protein